MADRKRRSVPGRQESFAPDAVVTRCPRCSGRDPNVSTCTTCGATGEVTLLPRASRASTRRVRLDLTIEEAHALLRGRPTPETTVRLAGALDRAEARSS